MRKFIYHIATSLDGFIADQHGKVDHFLMEGPHVADFTQALAQYDTVVMGRRTYEFGFQYGLQPGQPAYQGLKHIVASQSLDFESNDEVQLIKTDIATHLKQLKTQPGKAIWLCGGGKLAGYLFHHGLLDALWLKINPIILGNGIPLFEGLSSPLTLPTQKCEQKHYSNGVLLQKWRL